MGSIVRQYTTQEVGGFLKDSEGAQMPYEQGQGHAEGLHELSSAGKRRKNTTVADLRQRIVDEVKETVGAFDGCQIEAVTFALNSNAGQHALAYLDPSTVWYVFTTINVATQNFSMKEAVGEVFRVGSVAVAASCSRVRDVRVKRVAMKLIKNGEKLHIRTAYPMSAEGISTCSVFYRGGGQDQIDLPA